MSKNTTTRKIFSYDSVIDVDIDNFFKSLPERKDSLYIRTAIRLLIRFMEEYDGDFSMIDKKIVELNKKLGSDDDGSRDPQYSTKASIKKNESINTSQEKNNTSNKPNADNFVDIEQSIMKNIMNLGK